MDKNLEFKNVNDLIEFVVNNPGYGDTRFRLEDRTSDEWDDPETGNAWSMKLANLRNQSWYMRRHPTDSHDVESIRREYAPLTDDEIRSSLQTSITEMENNRPESHLVKEYHLDEHGSRYSRMDLHINLSVDLGDQIHAIWTKDNTYSFERRKGTLTLRGILRRLDADKGITARMAKAKAEKEARDLEAARKSRTFYTARTAKELLESVTRRPEYNEYDFANMTLAQIAALVVEPSK